MFDAARWRPAPVLAAVLVTATVVTAAQAAKDDLALVSRQSGAAGAGGRRQLTAGLDLGRRTLRRLLLGRQEPERRGRRRDCRRLRARPAEEHHHPGEPSDRAGGCGGRQRLLRRIDFGRRPLRRIHVRRDQPERPGRRWHVRRLRARPADQLHHAGEPGDRAGGRGRRRRVRRPVDLRRRAHGRLLLARQQPERPGPRRDRRHLRAGPAGRHDHAIEQVQRSCRRRLVLGVDLRGRSLRRLQLAREQPERPGPRRDNRRLRTRRSEQRHHPGEPAVRRLRRGSRRRLRRRGDVSRWAFRRLRLAGRQSQRRGPGRDAGRVRPRPRVRRHHLREPGGRRGGTRRRQRLLRRLALQRRPSRGLHLDRQQSQ